MLVPLGRRNIADEVFEQLREQIRTGLFPIGSRLPSEKDLCEELGVGRSSTREAIQKLQVLGYVDVRRGSGVYVVSNTGLAVDGGYSSWFEANKHKIMEIWELRVALESAAAALAAQRAVPEEVAEISRAQAEFEVMVATGEVSRIAQADEAFHYAILKAAHNEALVKVYDALRSTLMEYRMKTFSVHGAPPRAVAPHRMIVATIQSRLPGVAREAMIAHLQESRSTAEAAAHPAVTAAEDPDELG